MARLAGEKPGVNGRGIITGIWYTPPSDVGLSTLALDVGGGCVVDNGDERASSVLDTFFLLQGRRMAGVDSLVCRLWGGLSESSEEWILPTLVGEG